MNSEILILLYGLLAIFGVIIYAIGDVLMLQGNVRIEDYPKLQAHTKLLSGTEKMVALPAWRLPWGGLLGVFATPFVLAGFAQIFMGLSPAGLAAALPPVILFTCASIVGAFVHGSFIYLGEYVQALNKVSDDSQPVIIEMIVRHRTIMIITYAFLLGCILVASLWFSVVVGMGHTAFPVWMAAVNPLTAFMVWLAAKKVLPKTVVENTEGAGFNIAFLLFFILSTFTLWNG
jgi:hypothetical protein